MDRRTMRLQDVEPSVRGMFYLLRTEHMGHNVKEGPQFPSSFKS